MKKIVVFASGSGSNAEVIFNYFNAHPQIEVSALYCNKENAGVLQKAAQKGIPMRLFSRNELLESEIEQELYEMGVDLIVLAGFLWKIPESMVALFPNKIINLHPSILPKYGGKGMYGQKVHEAVLANQEKQSGISIHFVNAAYDEGNLILQAYCPVLEKDDSASLYARIQKLEHRFLPQVAEMLLLNT
ncbi:MAG: phosphoribosylglycinamide formyltransferase [Cyclobacteriaceae bacterium]|nr:phosphoribosylglycinamide formyltransferase [Cyclobacteriaceae bacterium]MCH8517557.1 phosphoribosylglycinamide formyltransferase [Cyclobacteriaceae bacterium]